ncbi:MAG: DNA polymerase III subunit delta' C-terminal domain-containing protein [Anaerolineae bacterium]|nr:DNA polymerase III subunit delta' C-terminal domain-containing protein [Anaerolineae bacterium]
MSYELYRSDWRIVGHEWAVRHVTHALNAGRLRHAYLLSGIARIGKTTFARAFAQAVNCLSEVARPCGVCRACKLTAQGNYADFTLIESQGNALKIEQIREMTRTLALRPVEGRYRVLVLRRFHEASLQAMDALLKTLEEPPPHVLLLLTADTTETLLPTIKSRCQMLNLRPLPVPTIREALITQYRVEPERAALIAQLSGGRMGWAIEVSRDDTLLKQRAEWLDWLEQTLGESRALRFERARQLSEDRANLPTLLALWQSYWRDALLLAHHTAVATITNRDRRHTLEQIARSAKTDDIYQALSAVRRTLRYLQANVNTRLALDALMLELPRLHISVS